MLLVYDLMKHAKGLLKTLEDAKADGSWVVMPWQEPLQYAGLVALQESIAAMNIYWMNPDSQKLHEGLINAGMNFNVRWDSWLVTAEFKSSASRVFHEILLRFSKGAARHSRMWLIDSKK